MAERLADGVWLLDVGWVASLDTNAFLVDDGEVTLVDAGLRVNRPSLGSELAEAGYAPGDLDRVLLTHYDLDHTGGLGGLRPDFTGRVYIGEADYDLYTGAADPPLFHHKGLFHRVARRLFPLPGEFEVRPVADGDRVGAFTAYHTPGHNPGHTVYVHDSGVAFLGDLLWHEDGDLVRPFWLDSYDTAVIEASVRAFAERVPPLSVLAVAHGRPVTVDAHDRLREFADGLGEEH